MHNQLEKNHSIKHGDGNVAKCADIINMSCKDGHKFCIKEPGGNTHQPEGPKAADHDESLALERAQCPAL